MLKQRGRIRAYGISTDSLDVLKHFNANDTCDVVELNYSMLNRAAEAELLPYCHDNDIAVLVRGPLRQGLLAGSYALDSVFTDSVRDHWNTGRPGREQFERDLTGVEALRRVLEPGEAMVTAALRYVISHPASPVVLPGAKSPAQAAMNALAGSSTLSPEQMAQLRQALDGAKAR